MPKKPVSKGKNRESAKSTASFRRVKWLDHASDSVWLDLEGVKRGVADLKKNPCVTRGYVAFEDKDILVLADGHDGHGNFGNTTYIWKKLIV